MRNKPVSLETKPVKAFVEGPYLQPRMNHLCDSLKYFCNSYAYPGDYITLNYKLLECIN